MKRHKVSLALLKRCGVSRQRVGVSVCHLPAADHGFTGQRQVQEGLAKLEGQSVLQGLAVND